MPSILQTVKVVQPNGKLTDYFRDWLRKLEFLISKGTAEGQVLRWDNTLKRWEAVSDVIINADGTVGIGTSETLDRVVHITSDTTTQMFGSESHDSNGVAGSNWRSYVSGGTRATPLYPAANQRMLTFNVAGWDENTGDWTNARAAIVFRAADDWTATSQPTTIAFETTAPDAVSVTERMRFDDDLRLKPTNSAYTEKVFTITPAASIAIDPLDGQMQFLTLGQNTTITLDDFVTGDNITLHIDDGSSYTVTWPTISCIGGSAPTLATSGWNVIVLWKAGSTLFGSFAGST